MVNIRTAGISILILAMVASVITGCAGARYDRMTREELKSIDDDQDNAAKKKRKNFGVTFYEGRPYILVVNGLNADGKATRTVQLITLPDYAHPHRAYLSRGFGKATLDLKLVNGVLTSTNSSSEEPLAAALTAVAGVAVVPSTISAARAKAAYDRAQAAVAAKEAVEPDRPLTCETDPSYKPVTGGWVKVMGDVRARIDPATNQNVKKPQESIQTKITEARDTIKQWNLDVCNSKELNFEAQTDAREILQVRLFEGAVESFVGRLDTIKSNLSDISLEVGCADASPDYCAELRGASHQIANLIADMKTYLPDAAPTEPFELYEFVYDDNAGKLTGLKKLNLGT